MRIAKKIFLVGIVALLAMTVMTANGYCLGRALAAGERLQGPSAYERNEVSGAAQPDRSVTPDPFLDGSRVNEQKLSPPNETSYLRLGGIGWSSCLDKNDAMVGAVYNYVGAQDPGRVYVYKRNDLGRWGYLQEIVPSNVSPGGQFGHSISMSGDQAIVGARWDDYNTGSAFIFKKNASGRWVEAQKLVASDAAYYDEFGQSVAMDGNRAIVGSPYDDDWGSLSGAAYILTFNPSNGLWEETFKITLKTWTSGYYFGLRVDIEGDYAIVAAYGPAAEGRVYVFKYNPATSEWDQTQVVTPNDGHPYHYFGKSIAISGNRIIAGAINDTQNGSWSGAAYIFERAAGSEEWTQTAKLVASDGQPDDKFGFSASLEGNMAVIGSPDDADSGLHSGSAYVFKKDPSGGWVQKEKLRASDGSESDAFGFSTSIYQKESLIGAYGSGDEGQGAAYIYGTNAD